MRLNVGAGPHRAGGWLNTDARIYGATRPDVACRVPFPFADDAFEAVYLGHVCEHVPWPSFPGFLAEVRRVLAPGAPVVAVGPDVYRTIQRWHTGQESWEQVADVLEHQDRPHDDWPEATHKWCCHEARLVQAFTSAGFGDVEGLPISEEALAGWPVVAFTQFQCAVRGVA